MSVNGQVTFLYHVTALETKPQRRKERKGNAKKMMV